MDIGQTNTATTESFPAIVRRLMMAVIVGGLFPIGGCRICADCEDLAYPAYGGAWQRTLRDEGRVGSIFHPGGAKASELAARDQPPNESELQRRRQQERGNALTDPESMMESPEEGDDRPRRPRSDELRDRKLEDIEPENEEELRAKELDDINVRIIPGQPLPPNLR